MTYFKLASHIKSVHDFTISMPPITQYLLHPNFVFVTTSPTRRSSSDVHVQGGWCISRRDLIEIPPSEVNPFITYNHKGSPFIVDCTDLQGDFDDMHYKGTKLTELSFSIETANSTLKYGRIEHVTKNFYDHYLKSELQSRYATLPYSYLQNSLPSSTDKHVIDSTVTSALIDYGFNIRNVQDLYKTLSANRYHLTAISPFVSRLTGIPQMPFADMCTILGYDRGYLKSLVRKVKANRYDFVFVGVGGTGMNTAKWLTEILNFTNEVKLFNSVTVHEEESAEFTNLFRFPIDFSGKYPTSETTDKIAMSMPYLKQLTEYSAVYTHFSYLPCGPSSLPIYSNRMYKNTEKPEKGFQSGYNPVLYGAPDLVSRTRLSPYGRFICATHANNSCSIWLNPSQDLDIQVESYGMIQLASFFMNQLRMAIGLLEILASDQDLMEQDKHLLEYEFAGGLVSGGTRNYEFKVEQNVTAALD